MQFYKTARDLRRDITKMLELMFYDESKFCYSRGLEYYLQTRMLLEEAKELYIPWRIDWIKKGGNPIPSDIAFVNIFARRAT